MIPETREQAERLNPRGCATEENAGVTDAFNECVQFLEKYLRKEADYRTLSNEHVAESFEKRLKLMAQDWARNHKYDNVLDERRCTGAARQAICRYLDNWEGKTPGNDDRGHRLGKSW